MVTRYNQMVDYSPNGNLYLSDEVVKERDGGKGRFDRLFVPPLCGIEQRGSGTV